MGMKTLFDQTVSSEILSRIEKITTDAKRQWGKMEVDQMLAHCANGLEMACGIIHPKRIFIGRIIGPLFRKKYSDEKPFDQGTPTSDELRITDKRNFEAEKLRLIDLLKKFSAGGERGVTSHPHPFFGLLEPAEWGIGMYKHLDHHLRQFGG
jgi:hypothetical protein